MTNNDKLYQLMQYYNLSAEKVAELLGSKVLTVKNYLRPAGTKAYQEVPDRVIHFLNLAIKDEFGSSIELDSDVFMLVKEAVGYERNMSVNRWINRTLKREAKAAIKSKRQENVNTKKGGKNELNETIPFKI